jgi:hypothetical protein
VLVALGVPAWSAPKINAGGVVSAASNTTAFAPGGIVSIYGTGLATSLVVPSWLDQTDAPVGVQRELMRHASIQTTMNVYGRAMTDSKRQAHGKVVEMVFNGPAKKASTGVVDGAASCVGGGNDGGAAGAVGAVEKKRLETEQARRAG